MDFAVETRGLTKQFASSQADAVSGVNLQVARGELFGLLGPNGAGKTTLVKMLCTLVLPTSGTATVAGFPLQKATEIRAAVGLMVTDDRSFYWRLSGRENLHFFAALHQIHGAAARKRVDEVLQQVGMGAAADRRFSDYSTGMRQRVALARCLLHRPQILFLDEPARSLDPLATQQLHALLRRLIEEQEVTIFLITHDLAEAEKLCSRVAVMHQGRLRAAGEPSAMRLQLTQQLQYELFVDRLSPQAREAVRGLAPDLEVTAAGERVRLRFSLSTTEAVLDAVLTALRENGASLYRIESEAPSLEAVFTQLTGEVG